MATKANSVYGATLAAVRSAAAEAMERAGAGSVERGVQLSVRGPTGSDRLGMVVDCVDSAGVGAGYIFGYVEIVLDRPPTEAGARVVSARYLPVA